MSHLAEQVFAPSTWRSWLWTRVVFAGATSVVIVAFLGFADGETVGDGGLRMLLIWGPWWLLPVAIYFAAVRTLFGIVVVGMGLFVSAFLALDAVFEDTHSTAGLGMAFFPIYFALAIGAYLALEWVAVTIVRRSARGRGR
jgi:hypothetical protein